MMNEMPDTSSGSAESKALRADLPVDKKKGRWFRRLRTLALLVLFLIVASRAIVVVLLPTVLHRVAGYYGMDCTYERLELSVLSGDTGLWHLVLTPKGTRDPLVVVEYCRGDISSLNLLRGKLAVWRVEADGVNLAIDRNADGSMPLLKLLANNSPAATQPTAAAKATTQANRPIDFSAPLRLDALRLTHIRLHVRDKAVTPSLDSVVSVDARLSDLGGESGRPTKFSADVDADPFLDALHVTGESRFDHGTIDATFQANVNGLRLRPLAPYLAAIGIRPLANETTMKASGELKVGPSPANPNIASATLQLNNVALVADGVEAAGLDHLTIDAPSLELRRIGFEKIALTGVRLNGRRAADGNVRFAGLEYVGVPAQPPTATPSPVTNPMALPVVDLPLFDVKGFAAHFHDDGIVPAADLSLNVDDFSVQHILLDPAHPDASIQIAGVAHAPGVAGAVKFGGMLQPMAAKKTVALNVSADQIDLPAIKPYLDQFGVTSTLHDATFSAAVTADVAPAANSLLVNASIHQIALKQDKDLFAMDHITLAGGKLAAAPMAISIDDISIAGPTVAVERKSDGSIAAAGLRFDPRRITKTSSRPINATTTPATQLAGASGLVIPVVKHFHWDGIDVSYDDNVLSPPIHTRVAEGSVDYKDHSLHVVGRVPKIVEHFQVDGSAKTIDDNIDGNLKLTASGIDSTIAKPFLEPFHLEPTLHDGAVDASLHAVARLHDQQLDGSITLSDVTYRDGDRELAGVDRVLFDRLSATPRSVSLSAIQVIHPRAVITHEKSGAIAAAGLRLLPDGLAPTPSSAATTSPQPIASSQPAASPFAFALNAVHLERGSLRIIDDSKSTDTTATATLDLEQVTTGPTKLSFHSTISGVIDDATVDGTLGINSSSPSADLIVKATGIRAGALAAYLPPGVTVPLHDGVFHASVAAAIAPAKAGGLSAKLDVHDLDFRESNAKVPLAKLTSARAIASRIDPVAGVFAIDEVSTDGIEFTATHTTSGGVRALGVDVETPSPSAGATTVPIAKNATTHPAESVASLVAGARKVLPTLQLDRLNLNVRRFTFDDEQRPSAAPVTVSDLRFRNLDRIDWGGADPDAHPLTHFRMDCTVDPAIGLVTVTAAAAPLASQPTLSLDVLASGIRGDGLTALVPELKSMIHGQDLVDGNFRMHLDTAVRLSRRGETGVDLNQPIDADLDLKPIQFRATGDGPILAGVDEIHSDGIHIEPKTGSVHLKTVEITKPIGQVSREKDGFHLLGLVFQPPTAATQPTTETTTAPLSDPTTAPSMRPQKPTAEIRVDQLVVNDLDFRVEDRTVSPPLIVPLNGLDVEVRDFTNLAPYEDRPLRFTALVNAGKVPLPQKKNPQVMEQRELFAQASANGSIGLYPAPNGFIKTSVGGFELGSLMSEAAQYKVKLSDGVFDSTVDAKLPGDGSIQTRARFVFTDLILSEPANGPISQFLHLGAPLDVVVGALQDPDGSITIPLDFPVKSGQLSPMALAGPAVGAFASIAATAIASAPLKAASAVTDLLGFGGKKVEAPEPPIALHFDSGDTTLNGEDLAAIAQLKARLTKDPALTVVIKHLLGGGDVKQAETRSNPSPEDARYLAEQMRQQQLASAELRSNLAGIARSDVERGAESSADDTLARLKQVDARMARTDDAMDRLYELLRPGADRLASRRTRSTCLEYGKNRLAAIQSALLDHAPADIADRIHLLTPQYSQPADDAGGTVLVQLIPKKK